MNVPIKRGTARRLGIVRPLPPGVYWAPLPGPRGIAAVTASAARGTARRLGLRLPPGVYYAPLRWTPLTEADLSDFTTKLAQAVQGWKPSVWLGRKP